MMLGHGHCPVRIADAGMPADGQAMGYVFTDLDSATIAGPGAGSIAAPPC